MITLLKQLEQERAGVVAENKVRLLNKQEILVVPELTDESVLERYEALGGLWEKNGKLANQIGIVEK